MPCQKKRALISFHLWPHCGALRFFRNQLSCQKRGLLAGSANLQFAAEISVIAVEALKAQKVALGFPSRCLFTQAAQEIKVFGKQIRLKEADYWGEKLRVRVKALLQRSIFVFRFRTAKFLAKSCSEVFNSHWVQYPSCKP